MLSSVQRGKATDIDVRCAECEVRCIDKKERGLAAETLDNLKLKLRASMSSPQSRSDLLRPIASSTPRPSQELSLSPGRTTWLGNYPRAHELPHLVRVKGATLISYSPRHRRAGTFDVYRVAGGGGRSFSRPAISRRCRWRQLAGHIPRIMQAPLTVLHVLHAPALDLELRATRELTRFRVPVSQPSMLTGP
ncbi:hypothetical protein G7K_5143-t1 [Saitoella complicata NRRL Y-17804]|uniref:Uncharacterized protein n=1 Tax=Saitoella complicata (strain BCRC 22490 / CBS 7301 / JCM 7358 / NBRC 10748 / NRRL Y-17804) TaxID=698492 RepID=A0A0E9NMX6_SAICN|nr:hypothetical protein G7K_5143-t1 [Saitoella complicata NRRL Y-17804]